MKSIKLKSRHVHDVPGFQIVEANLLGLSGFI